MVEHIVLFKLREGTTKEEKEAILETLRELANLDGVAEFSVGLNHSKEGKSKGFEVGMRIAFRDQAALDAYVPSERHIAIVDRVRKHFADVIVVDYTP